MRSGSALVLAAVGWVGVVPRSPAQAQTPPPPQREGRITVARATHDGKPGSSVDAMFSSTPVWGTVMGSDGPCTLHKHVASAGLSAGTITITGTAQPLTLDQSGAGQIKYRHTGAVPDPLFAEGAAITVAGSGGVDVPAFTASVTAPAELAGYAPPSSLSRTGYTASWTAGAGPEVMILIGAFDRRFQDGVFVMCRVADTGAFTVPASTFALIPSSFDRAIVMVARVAETVQMVGETRLMFDVTSSVGAGPFTLGPSERDRVPASAETSPRARWETSARRFYGVALGMGGVSRNGEVPPIHGSSWRLQLGQRLAHGLHLVEEFNSIDSGDISQYPIEMSEGHLSLGAGVRWTPFEPNPQRQRFPAPGLFIDTNAWYLTAVLGANVRDRFTQTSPTGSTEATDWSPMASLALGLLELQGHDWSLGPEVREQLTRYDGHFQRGWEVLVAIHLDER